MLAANRPCSTVQEYLVNVAPAPALVGLERPHDRMLRRSEVTGGVPFAGVVRAADMATGHAQAQMTPAIARCQAIRTTRTTWCNVGNLIQVRAAGGDQVHRLGILQTPQIGL